MGKIDTIVEVTYLGKKLPNYTPNTARLSINTFSWLQIKNTGQSSPQILKRIHNALIKVNPRIPNSISWTDISVKLSTSKPVSE